MIIVGRKDGRIEKTPASSVSQKIKGYNTHTVLGGEFAVVSDSEDIALKTLLGSCVALMFYDRVNKIKSMNHFLLPTTSDNTNDMKYGLYSVEAMLNEMFKMGSLKSNIFAKISGGADIMNLNLKTSIGERNVEFAKEFCQKEGIRIISEHTRGTNGRLILLANNFETFIKSTQKSETVSKIASNEKSLQIEISKAPVIKEYSGAIELFGKNKDKLDEKMEIELF
ncbi:Chemoreceptor glutamine deamidase CheD [Aliarcobacter thereius]|uniref:Probable chemoreceptor glutamine deamidase CheD n=2 Tax=Aliarcobacter thereius TaxID=544718 RepID=A0A1C0B6V4_9BACT|nr:chemotaxis protein CheD [Aliarcobacter thereius]OCL86962.1 Chemoreceptor glutamine deamidase CheD [Aliarcobacter thereius]OCL91143.1 Chemoreceptor glutamine deamidase CheD [Aliarcobacter thereius]OCL96004.1 Chemoreceptor glutamine deamidase CheD [Aliarcobacter thereius LMG 24486]OCL99335.1 Chemoreceptor glutamine deamidase CheD [Aliarcobacter thereius]QBF16024.1 chemotaxis protein CheD [Aliarcobacter thereius LMG 24486]